MAGLGGEQFVPVVGEKSGSVNPADVQKAERETESAYSELMDRIEQGADTRGQYFIKVGEKDYLPAGFHNFPPQDTRALIFTTSVLNAEGRKFFIALTRKGVKGIKVENLKAGGEWFKDVVNSRLDPTSIWHLDERLSGGEGFDGRIIRILPTDIPIDLDSKYRLAGRVPTEINMDLIDVDTKLAQQAIAESQRNADIPLQLRLRQAEQELANAGALSSFVDQLPPKTIDSAPPTVGPTAPQPQP